MTQGESDRQAQPRHHWRPFPAWLPIPLLLVAMVVLWATNSQTSHESPFLLVVSNFLFSTLGSVFVAYLVGRSFLVRGSPGLLLLGCGVLISGFAGVVGSAVGEGDPNDLVTIHNTGVALSGLCQLVGALLLLRSRRAVRSAGLLLAVGYAASLGALGLTRIIHSRRHAALPGLGNASCVPMGVDERG